MGNKMFKYLSLFSAFLTLIIITLGSFIRLSGVDQGLISENLMEFLKVNIHDYLAIGLGFSVFTLGLFSWRQHQFKFAAVTVSFILIILVAMQAVLGIWAKELEAMPIILVVQVLLGMITFWGFFWLSLRSSLVLSFLKKTHKVDRFVGVVILGLFLQITLGIWVSANHAGLVCVGFPQCNGQWWPNADYYNALNLLSGLFTGYTGVISFEAQVAANWLHRVGALLNFILLSLVMFRATATNSLAVLRKAGIWLGVLLFTQIVLAIMSSKMGMPAWSVLVHHVVATLLMLPLIAISFYSKYEYLDRQVIDNQVVELKSNVIGLTEDVSITEPVFEEAYVELPAESLYLRLKSQLKRTRSGLSGILASLPIGEKEINDDLLEEIEASLLMADVGVDATAEIISHLTKSVERHQLTDGVALSIALKQELLSILNPCSIPLCISKQDTPFVILVVGVNGAGKTTTIGKLAKRLQAQGHSVMLAAGDTFRAAAVEQLEVWGERNNIHVVAQHTGADSASVIYDGLQSAKAKGIDVLIADTAGRLHTKSNLMDELKKVKRIMSKLDEKAPHEVLLVLDAGTGQNALSQAKLFNEALSLTGLVLTKLDGTAKGGVIFALAKHAGIPIRFIGIGEGIDDLQDFDSERFVDALFVKD